MPLTEDDEVVEALAANGADEALGVGVEVWAASWQPQRPDAGALEEGAKVCGEDGVAIHDEVLSNASSKLRATCIIHPTVKPTSKPPLVSPSFALGGRA
jgi:hypothetical protein